MTIPVVSKSDIIEKILEFDSYKNGPKEELEYYQGRLRNSSNIIAYKRGVEYTFTSPNFAGYKDSNIETYYNMDKERFGKLLGCMPCKNDAVEKEFNKHCKKWGCEKETERKNGLKFWIIENTIDLPNLNDLIETDEEGEEEARKLPFKELKRRALAASTNATKNPKQSTTTYHPRNGDIAAYVKEASKGLCNLCEKQAPFTHKGKPFLESHHVKPLAKGGMDTVENTVALCPNCHRKMHSLNMASDKQKLRDWIKRRDGGNN
jgi:predicted HNH restriction endonuclease